MDETRTWELFNKIVGNPVVGSVLTYPTHNPVRPFVSSIRQKSGKTAEGIGQSPCASLWAAWQQAQADGWLLDVTMEAV